MTTHAKCVHTEHCCNLHGCKYGDDDCPVVLGIKPQSFLCEECREDERDASESDHEAARAADKARIAELTEVLRDARDMVADWGAYASEYFREKHSLAGDLARIDAALDKEKSP